MAAKPPDKISRRKLQELLDRKEDQLKSDHRSKKIITKLTSFEKAKAEARDITKPYHKEVTLDDIMDLRGMLGGNRAMAPLEGQFLMTPEEEQISELGLSETLDEIFSSGIGLPPDLKIDDRDLKALPNVFEWTTSKMGAKMKPYARQYEVMIKSCSEWCPPCTKKRWPKHKMGFAKSFHYSPALPVDFDVANIDDYVQHLENGRCPCCKKRKSELVRSGQLPLVTELDMCLGQRAGKSATIYSLIPYLIHRWLKVPSPVQALGLLDNTLLSGVVVALTYAKATSLLWQPIHNAISNTGWFKEYNALLNHYQEFYGEEFFKLKDSFVQYGHRNMIFSPSGPNKRTLRGETRIWTGTDEIGFFYHGDDGDDKERASANEVYVSLGNSLFTVKKAAETALLSGMDGIPMTLMANISSPSSYKDKIMSLIREFENEPTVVTMHLPTWEFNPKTSKGDFKKEYAADPVKADRDFGANPPMSENPYLPDLEPMKRQVLKSQRNMVEYEYKLIKATNGAPQRYAKIKRLREFMDKVPKHVMTIDAGHSNNSFALTVGYPEMYRGKLRLVCTGVVEVAPTHGQNTINFTKIAKEMIYPLIEHFNVGLVVTDRWNSLKLLHDIEDEYGIFTLQYSLRPDDFNFIYDYYMDEDFAYARIPVPEIPIDQIMDVDIDEYPKCFGPGNKTTGRPMPVAHMIHQSQTVQVNSRGSVDKGLGLTDDIFRAFNLLTYVCVDEEYVEEYMLLTGSVAGEKRAIGAMARGGITPGSRGSGGKAMTTSVGAVAGASTASGSGGNGVFSRTSR
ncbi:terminase large subunit [Pseudomonas phage vB_PpuM-Pori-4]